MSVLVWIFRHPNAKEAAGGSEGQSTHNRGECSLVSVELEDETSEKAAEDLAPLVNWPEHTEVEALARVGWAEREVLALGHPYDGCSEAIENNRDHQNCLHEGCILEKLDESTRSIGICWIVKTPSRKYLSKYEAKVTKTSKEQAFLDPDPFLDRATNQAANSNEQVESGEESVAEVLEAIVLLNFTRQVLGTKECNEEEEEDKRHE